MAKINDWEIISRNGQVFISEDGSSAVVWDGKPCEVGFVKHTNNQLVIQVDKYVIHINEKDHRIIVELG